MKCDICGKEGVRLRKVSETHGKGEDLLVIEDIPMFSCPHCEKPGISPVRKAILSPGLLATCNACSETSTLRYRSWITAMMPGSVLMVASMFVDSDSAEWALNIAGLSLMIIVPLIYAPLHKED